MIQKVAIGHRALTFSGLGVLNLRSQVVSDVALVLIVLVIDLVLDHEWHVLGHRQTDLAWQRRRLRKEVQVAQRKGERDRLAHIHNDGLLLLVDRRRLRQLYVAVAEVAFGAEAGAVFGAADDHRVAQDAEVAADARELGRGHLDDAGVLGVGNAQVLGVQVHQLHLVVAGSVLFCCQKEVNLKGCKVDWIGAQIGRKLIFTQGYFFMSMRYYICFVCFFLWRF